MKVIQCLVGLVALTLAGHVFAAGPDLYGKAHLSLAFLEDDAGDAMEIKSNSSRLGVKGDVDVDESLKVTYMFEFGIDMSDDSTNVSARNQYVGLAGHYGEVRIGRHDTPYKTVSGAYDLFGDTVVDYNNIINSGQDKRANNTIIYLGTFDAIGVSASYSLKDETLGGENTSIVSLSATYALDGLSFLAALQEDEDIATTLKIGGMYADEQFMLGLLLEKYDADAANSDETNLMLIGQYKLDDKNTIKAGYGMTDDDADTDPNMLYLGINHKLADSINLYFVAGSGADNGLSPKGGLNGDGSVIQGGIVLSF